MELFEGVGLFEHGSVRGSGVRSTPSFHPTTEYEIRM